MCVKKTGKMQHIPRLSSRYSLTKKTVLFGLIERTNVAKQQYLELVSLICADKIVSLSTKW